MEKTHINVQGIHSAQKPGGFKAIRNREIGPVLSIRIAGSYGCSW